jgi:hypothetical protein
VSFSYTTFFSQSSQQIKIQPIQVLIIDYTNGHSAEQHHIKAGSSDRSLNCTTATLDNLFSLAMMASDNST